MNVCDWREAGHEVLKPLYERGHRAWLSALGWETSSTWRHLEQARTTWGLPGLLAVDDAGQVRGWSFFLPQNGILQVGGLAADTPLATSALLDAILDLSESHDADGVSCFMFDEAAGLADEITRRGFDAEPFLYLSRDLTAGSPPADRSGADVWRSDDVVGAAELLRCAYGAEAAKHFAPGNTPAAWERYVQSLVEQTGLGRFNLDATRVVRGSGRTEALVLVTALSDATAHLAQIAVHASSRGKGLATALVSDACHRAAQQGYTRATLLVGASNTPARRLYATLGFTPTARFVAAQRGMR